MVTPDELKEKRMELIRLEQSLLNDQFIKWEKKIDKWLRNNPKGGTYYFLWWNIPSYQLRELICEKYRAVGWHTQHYGGGWSDSPYYLDFWIYDE